MVAAERIYLEQT